MSTKVLFITPPFTQLNTAYPATAYLTGFLKEKGVETNQCDLSIEVFNALFTKEFIIKIFKEAQLNNSFEFTKVWQQRQEYIDKVDTIISYLQHHEVTKAYQILSHEYLPKSHRFDNLEDDLDWAFGNLGILDKAKHFATLFIEELGDFIRANVDEFFAFTNYAEQIGTSASNYDKIEEFLSYEPTILEEILLQLLEEKIKKYQPNLVAITIPFPGNLFAALRCAQYIKQHYTKIKIAFGGGYCNTELRSLTDTRIFKHIDFISLDDGESPLLKIIQFLNKEIKLDKLERTFVLENNNVVYKNALPNTIFHHKDLPAPTYQDLIKNKYLSFLDVMNPMHRLWSDGRWNKLTISHGCYWKQCTFCDVSLDYVGNYQITSARKLVDKIKKIVAETGTTGFHFVDEAAPPKILKALAELLIAEKIFITWWTNIRFEKTFTEELCQLLAK